MESNSTKEKSYKVSGMHCASCELIIEKKLLGVNRIQAAEASTNRGEVVIEYEGETPKINDLNDLFKKENYNFSAKENEENLSALPSRQAGVGGENNNILIMTAVLLIVMVFIILNSLGISNLINVSSNSSLLAFVALGVVAGLSSCAALVGGIVLSMSKQWSELYSKEDKTMRKLQPHLLFNAGRIVSYAFFGAVLGLLGSRLQISVTFTSMLVLAVSLLMVFLGLQMLGVKYFQKFQLSMPKFATRYVADESNFKGKYMPVVMGALTFLLPCGFTITAQGIALLSASPMQGALIMLAFVLGTTPTLLAIGLTSVKLNDSKFSTVFPKVAGILVLFFALFNMNNQLSVLGISNLSDLKVTSQASGKASVEGLAPMVNGKQLLKMDASSRGYSPNTFKIKVGVPVRWEITDTGTSGCTNAIISKSLFEGQIDLTPGQVSVKEFTPTKAGRYKFSCWMGMVTGTIDVVDANGASNSTGQVINTAQANEIPSGVKGGCGCGGGGTAGGSGSCH